MLVRFSRWCFGNPRTTLAVALVLAGLSLWVTVRDLDLRTNFTDLFSGRRPVARRMDALRREFPLPEDIVVLVDGNTPMRRKAFLDELGQRLRRDPNRFQDVYVDLDASFLRSGALFYLSRKQLASLADSLQSLAPYLDAFGRKPGLQTLLATFTRHLRSPRRAARALSQGNLLLGQLLANLKGQPIEPLGARLSPEHAPPQLDRVMRGDTTFYNRIGDCYYLLVKPVPTHARMTPDAASLERLRKMIAAIQPGYPNLRVRLTGEPVILTEERDACYGDTLRSSLLALCLVALLFILGFRELRRPLMGMAALVLGLVWTLGFTTIIVGRFNILSLTAIAMLAGLGIGFDIQLTFRYFEERHSGKAPAEALDATMVGAGATTLAGAALSTAGFWALAIMGFRGVAELGIIAGAGLLLCFLSAASVLPALFSLTESVADTDVAPCHSRRRSLQSAEGFLLRHSRSVVVLSLLISACCFAALPRVHFDGNLLDIEAPGLSAIRTEIEMVNADSPPVLTAISLAPNLNVARARTQRFQELPSVRQAVSVAQLIPSAPRQKLPLVERIVHLVAPITLPPAKPPRQNPGNLARALQDLARTWNRAWPGLRDLPQAQLFDRRFSQLQQAVRRRGPGPIMDAVHSLDRQLCSNLRTDLRFLKAQTGRWATLKDIPRALRVRSIGPDGVVQIRVFPARDIWNRGPLATFTQALATVDPRVTGDPLLMQSFQELVASTRRTAVWAALAAVLLLLQLFWRNLRAVALTLIPTGLAVLWMVGLMGAFDIPLNPANFVALPILVGVGSVFGVHIVHRVSQEGSARILSSCAGAAVLLSGLATVAGFASLLSSVHRGTQSLGLILAFGVLASLWASLVLVPCIDQIMNENLE